MTVKISKIKPHVGASKYVDESGSVKIDDNTADINVCGELTNKEATYEFRGSIKGIVHTYCAKCLKNIDYPYETKFVQLFKEEGQNLPHEVDEDVFEFIGDEIDFELFAASIIRADMPIALVCVSECKGLCEVCGCDLNERACDCVKEYTNPIFNELKVILKDNEEV